MEINKSSATKVKTSALFSAGRKYLGKWPGASFTLAAALGLWFFIAARSQKTAVDEISRSLMVINTYKADEISDWLGDNVREAVRLSRNPILGGLISEEISNPGSRRAQLNAWLMGHLAKKQYTALAFLSPKGSIITATPGYAAGTEKYFTEALARVLEKGTPSLTDLYLAADGRPRMAMVIPVSVWKAPEKKPLCALVINIDPQTELYPMLKAAPLFFGTAETLLVRKEGEEVLYLNELAYSKDSALKLQRPLSDADLPSAKALKEGYSGFFKGLDYRGVEVFSALDFVKGANWAVITQIDRDIILGPVNIMKYLELAVMLLAAGLIYGVFYAILRFREQVAQKVIQESEELLSATLRSIGDAVITTDAAGLVMSLNSVAEHLTGWITAEAKGRPVMDIFRIINSVTRAAAQNPVERALRENIAVGLANHTALIARDGTEYQIADSCAPIHDASGAVFGVVLVFRDVTEAYMRSEQLRQSEAKYKGLFDESRDAVMLLKPPSWNFTAANAATLKMFRTETESELTRRAPASLSPERQPDGSLSVDKSREMIKKALREGSSLFEWTHKRISGEEFPATVLLSRIGRDKNVFLQASVRDISEQKKNEDLILNINNQLQTIMSSTPTMIFYKDKENRFIRVNKALAEATGLSIKEMEGHTLWDIYPRETAELYWQDDKTVIASGKPRLNIVESMKTPAGLRWVQTDKIPFRDSAGAIAGVIGFTTDITERKLAETYVEMRREILQILNDLTDLPSVIRRVIAELKTRTGFDAVGIRLQNGEDFPYFSQDGFPKDFLRTENTLLARDAAGAVCRDKDGKVELECTCGLVISGKTDPSSPLFTRGGSFWTNNSLPLLDLPADKDPRHNPRNQCMHHGYASMALIPIRNKDRIVGLIHIDDKRKEVFTLDMIERLEGIAANIGAALMRRTAEEALKQMSDRLILATRAGGVGVWDYDIVNNILVWDDSMYALYGITRDTFGGAYESWRSGLHPDDQARGDMEIQTALRGEKEFNTEFRVVWPDGSIHNIRALSIIQRDGSGKPLRMIGTNWDITAQKQAERTVTENAEVKSRFASMVSHELRSPLTSITLGVGLILEDAVGLSAEHKSLLELVRDNTDRLGRLINNVLDFQKISAGKMPFDIRENDIAGVVSATVRSMSLMAKAKGLDLAADISPDLPRAMFDKDKIIQVLTNLLANAIAHTEKGIITVRAGDGNNMLRVSVRDTGGGIKAANLSKLFQPFEQLGGGGKHGGTGLGLAISKEIIVAHKGKIWAESEEGKGSVFHFELPLIKAGG